MREVSANQNLLILIFGQWEARTDKDATKCCFVDKCPDSVWLSEFIFTWKDFIIGGNQIKLHLIIGSGHVSVNNKPQLIWNVGGDPSELMLRKVMIIDCWGKKSVTMANTRKLSPSEFQQLQDFTACKFFSDHIFSL